MDNRVEVMNFGQLKHIIATLENNEEVTKDTKVFIDTGWDSVQEIEPNAIHLEEIIEFKVQDVVTTETYIGYSLKKKSKQQATGEKAIIIRNLY